MMLTLSADELVQLVVKHGYVRAAEQVGCHSSHLWQVINRAGRCDEVSRRRGRLPKTAIIDAARILGVSKSTVNNMRQDGRLPKAFTDADVAALLGKWKLVVQSELPPTVRLCKVCGAYFKIRQSWVEQGRGTTCSIKCRDTLRWGERRVEKPKPPKTVAVRISKRPVRRIFLIDSSGVCASAGKYSPDKVYADQVCLECGERFSPALTNRRKYCSLRCARRVARRKDKARERGIVELEHVSLDLVLQRDNYQCWICKKKIDPTLDRSKDPMGATRDHIQPRHFGGVNAYWNVKAAHRSCNSSRGHRDEFQTAMPIAA